MYMKMTNYLVSTEVEMVVTCETSCQAPDDSSESESSTPDFFENLQENRTQVSYNQAFDLGDAISSSEDDAY